MIQSERRTIPTIRPIFEVEPGFVSGFLRTTRDALVAPTRFYGTLPDGQLARPYAFAVVSLFLLMVVSEATAFFDHSQAHQLGVYTAVRVLVVPILAAALLMAIGGALWTVVTRVLGARIPYAVAARAIAYQTSIASTFGTVLAIASVSPESAPFVITWYLTLLFAYGFTLYTWFRLARGRYNFPVAGALAAIVLYLVACVALGALGLFLHAQLTQLL